MLSKKLLQKNKHNMIRLIYFDFNFWRVDILRLCLGFSNTPYEMIRIPRKEWREKKKDFPFGQLPVMIINNKKFAHTHSLARFCAVKSNLYDDNDLKRIIIDQVIDWANEITNKIAPSIRAAMREKNLAKSKKLRKEFIDNDLLEWFTYLEKLLGDSSKEKLFFTDRFSIADVTAWRVIHWFYSRKLDQIEPKFLNKFTLLKHFYESMNNFEKFAKLQEYKEIVN